MSPSILLKAVYQKYPELADLLVAEQKLIEKALIFAVNLSKHEDLLSEDEHNTLLKKLNPKGIMPSNSLKAYRLREDLTQKELAIKSGISQSNISAMEKGSRPIGLNVAIKLAKILRCDYKKLL